MNVDNNCCCRNDGQRLRTLVKGAQVSCVKTLTEQFFCLNNEYFEI